MWAKRRTIWWVGMGLSLWGLVGGVGGRSSNAEAVAAAVVSAPYLYDFQTDGVVEETGTMQESTSPYWWVNSGGRLIIKNGLGMTMQGDAPATDKWRALYALSSPVDTDAGTHPQNLFRLVTRSQWENFSQAIAFCVQKLNVSTSSERSGWSGVLLFNRYLDAKNLYYVGLRHDGTGIIKKKRFGIYYTLAQKLVFSADTIYQRDTNPNLLPGKRWLGLKSVIRTNADQSVTLQLWVDRQFTGTWELALETIDTNGGPDGAPILGSGYAGLRTDFADVQFDNYRIDRL
ncbi:MAG: hypothetical protein HYZ73_06540 [Elusimicrobia bacterium]|nr:hypothetical protein [Elusimicrobiota bacterium]